MKAMMSPLQGQSDDMRFAHKRPHTDRTNSTEALRRAEKEAEEVRALLEKTREVKREIQSERFRNNFAEMMLRAYRRKRHD